MAAVRSMVEQGDIDGLTKLMREDDLGPRTIEWTLIGLRDGSMCQYHNIGTRLLTQQTGSRINPLIWYHMSQELGIKAGFTDWRKYGHVMERYPLQAMHEAYKEIIYEAGEKYVSFSQDDYRANRIFETLFETHKKLVRMLAGLAAIIFEDSRWNKSLGDPYLRSVSEGRYKMLCIDENQRHIRNAIAHRDFVKTSNTDYTIVTQEGTRRKISIKKLDEELNNMMVRESAIYEGMILPSAFAAEIMRVVWKNSISQQSS